MPMPPPPAAPQAFTERELLHTGGRAGLWGSLGCWAPGTPDYATACEALTARVADAARVQPGARVLCLACGAGDELQWLLNERGAAQVTGVERDAALQAAARQHVTAGLQVLQGDGLSPEALGFMSGSFDQVLCVDAAYHLRPRQAVL